MVWADLTMYLARDEEEPGTHCREQKTENPKDKWSISLVSNGVKSYTQDFQFFFFPPCLLLL